MASSGKLIVGIDFGVLLTSVSWCLILPTAGSNATVRDLIFGPAEEVSDDVQPSKISASPNSTGWGNGIVAGEKSLELLKLSLLHEDKIYRHSFHRGRLDRVKKAIEARRDAGLSGVEACAEYLRRVWSSCQIEIGLAMQAKHRLQFTDVSVCFVFGVPAAWDDYTISRMKEAVCTSGVLNVGGKIAKMETITEPEAAATTILPQLHTASSLKIGETVVICDCGGGTVDVISYEIGSISPVVVREIVSPDGALLGESFFISTFETMVQDLVSEHLRPYSGVQFSVHRFKNQLTDIRMVLERSPLRFGDGRHYRLVLEQDDGLPVMFDGAPVPPLLLPWTQVLQNFRSLTDDIVGLVNEQFKGVKEKTMKDVDHLVVVGGFGQNPFLLQELHHNFGSKVYSAERFELGVVSRGATLAAVERHNSSANTVQQTVAEARQVDLQVPMHVVSRVARSSYGYLNRGNIVWFLLKGADIPTRQFRVELPKEAFMGAFDQSYSPVGIYVASDGDSGPRQVCQVTCLVPAILLWPGVPNPELSLRFAGGIMSFEVLMDGKHASDTFIVEIG